jgi:hypothetical protein
MKAVTFALALSLVACRQQQEAVTFPIALPRHAGPAQIGRVSVQALQRIAGAEARDCGIATDLSANARVVVQCATESLRRRQPFYCRFEPRPPDPNPPSVGEVRRQWSSETAYAGTNEGDVYLVTEMEHSSVGPSTTRIVERGEGTPNPMRVIAGMTPPAPRTMSPAIETQHTEISGIIILETVIDEQGVPREVKTLKPLPHDLDLIAQRMVRESRFDPARLFDVALPSYWNVTVHVDKGRLWLEKRSHR